MEIIRSALSEAIEKYVGLSVAQRNYIQNIDSGMSKSEAFKQFEIDNLKEWNYFVYQEKNQLYCLYVQLFESPLKIRKRKWGIYFSF